MSVVYSENFEAYSVGKALTDNPPNFVTTGSSGSWTVQNGLSGVAAANTTTASWAHAMYNGASYTYTDLSVRCKRGGVRANIFARASGLNAGNSIPTDGYQVQVIAGTVELFKSGYGASLGSWAGNPADTNDYVVRLLCNGTSIKVYIDGVERISVTDATYSSGKIGIGTFTGTDARFDEITVNDGAVTGSASGPLFFRRRRGR